MANLEIEEWVCFEGRKITIFKAVEGIRRLIVEGSPLSCLHSSPANNTSSPSSFAGLIKNFSSPFFLCCDGAYQLDSGKAAAAFIALDSNLELINGIADLVNVSSSLGAEAVAIRVACILCLMKGSKSFVVCCDSKQVVDLKNSSSPLPREIALILEDIRYLRSKFDIYFVFVPRSLHFVTH
ncbi:hypothetical protein LguiA_025584 [Lonicera macranthoides]